MSRQILDTFKDADGLPVQEYYAAFMIEHRIERLAAPAHERAARNADFMAWMNERWLELEQRLGFTWTERGLRRKDMLDYLENRAVDHVARNAVEAVA